MNKDYYDDEALISAFIAVESKFHTYHFRFDPYYRWLWDIEQNKPFRKLTVTELTRLYAPHKFPGGTNEFVGQKMFYGLTGLNGAVARQHGFYAPCLTELFDPDNNVRVFATVLKEAYKSYFAQHGLDGVVASMNTGKPIYSRGVLINQDYVDKVKMAYESYRRGL